MQPFDRWILGVLIMGITEIASEGFRGSSRLIVVQADLD